MGTINNRVALLEKHAFAAKGLGRVFRTIGGMPDDDAAGFLRAKGQQLATTDMVIRRTLWNPGADGPECVPHPLRMAWVTG